MEEEYRARRGSDFEGLKLGTYLFLFFERLLRVNHLKGEVVYSLVDCLQAMLLCRASISSRGKLASIVGRLRREFASFL